MLQVLDTITNFSNKYRVIPDRNDIFNMFRMLPPSRVRVVMVAQSPYPGRCPATQVPYACGPALLPAAGCATTPATLKNVMSEVYRDMRKTPSKSPRDTLLSWVEQGVLFLNSSLTLGRDCPRYLEDHSVVWEEVMRMILSAILEHTNPIFVLIGKDAWKLETSVSTGRVIKVSHPVARSETSTPWAGSGVFSAVSHMMVENGDLPVKW
jgi:uracil-DNA glycosylase